MKLDAPWAITHRGMLAIETVFLTLPVSLLFLLGATDIAYFPYLRCGPLIFVLRVLVVVMAGVGLLSGWILTVRFMRKGDLGAKPFRSKTWVGAVSGSLVALFAYLSEFLPPSDPYGCWDVFRSNIAPVRFGLMLVIPKPRRTLAGLRQSGRSTVSLRGS
jgi:hypothetical protein